jgi:hypothetical protein
LLLLPIIDLESVAETQENHRQHEMGTVASDQSFERNEARDRLDEETLIDLNLTAMRNTNSGLQHDQSRDKRI